jgi:LysR family glycine cleavage system transcriptional activator
MNPPPIQWLAVFAAAAEHLNFSKAAAHLNVSPPAVSQQIKALEDYLGTPLFKRKGPRLELTEAGDFYSASVSQMMQTYQSGFKEFDRRFNRRSLRLNTPLFIAQEMLIPNYMGYKQLQPDTELRISTGTEYIDFDTNIADAAIRFGDGNWPHLHARLLSQTQISPVCSATYKQHNIPASDQLSELVDNQVLLTTFEKADEWYRLLPDINPRDIIVCDSYFSVIKSAEQGLGVALGIFPAINNWVNNGQLSLMAPQLYDSNTGYWLVYPKQRKDSDMINACYQWARKLFDGLPELDIQ